MILGGLVAGLAFNLLEAMIGTLVTAKDFQAALSTLGKRMPQTPGMMAYYVALGFVMGIALVWLYAAIRPRFGPGPRTAICAGLVGWLFMAVFNALGEGPPGIMPVKVHLEMVVAWVVEMPLATLAGARFYTEM